MMEMVFYIKKLHSVIGNKLYINLFSMIIVSLLEGIGIYLLLPMLSIIGIFNIDVGKALPIPWISDVMKSLPGTLNLPFVLAIYLIIVIGQALLQRNQSLLNSKVQQNFIRALRFETYKTLMQAKWSFFLTKRNSDLINILTTELARVSQGTQMMMQLFASLIFTVIQICLALLLSVKLTLVILLSGIVIFILLRKFVKKAKIFGDRTSELSQSYFLGITEHISGIKDIKSNRLEQIHLTWFDSLCQRIEHNVSQFVKLNSTTQFIHRTTAAILIVVFILLSFEVLHVRPEQLMLIILIFSRLWPRFTSIQSNIEYFVSMIPAFKVLMEVQQESLNAQELKSQEFVNHANPLRIEQGIECRNVYFRYNLSHSSYALHHINLNIQANCTTAIVGRSGAGKSTLIDILMGIIQPEEGQILIDGTPLTNEQVLPLRSSISYVSQDPFLFHTSIRENLMLVDPNASEEKVWEALKFASAAEFVERLPQGLDTIIGDRGIRLSGGERQRIVLARAILRKPSILVLDEATSALDSENEVKIQEALDRLKGNMTIIVIAHRLSTIRNADQVIVLDKGEIIQQGGYQQLSKESRGMFSKLLGYQAEASL